MPHADHGLFAEDRAARHFINWQQDPQSNYLARVVFPEPVPTFPVEVDLVAEMAVINPFDFFLEPYAEQFPFTYEAALARGTRRLISSPSRPARSSQALVESHRPRRNDRTIDFLVDLNSGCQQRHRLLIRMEPGIQTPRRDAELRSGSCRDTAWLLVQMLRHLGLAARFVSGYLIQLKADVKSLDGPAGPAADFTDLHAWSEVYLPGAGWVGLDPTSGLFAGEGHIRWPRTPDPASAAPITGGVDPCEVEFIHEMSVTRIHEDPRVTMPYTDEQWKRIEALGPPGRSQICRPAMCA